MGKTKEIGLGLSSEDILIGCALFVLKDNICTSPKILIRILAYAEFSDGSLKNLDIARSELKIFTVEKDFGGPGYEWPKSENKRLKKLLIEKGLIKKNIVGKHRGRIVITPQGTLYFNELKTKGFEISFKEVHT